MKFVVKCLLSLLVAQTMGDKLEGGDDTVVDFKGTHLDDIDYLENFKWDKVKFMTRKDCALDPYPAVSFIDSINSVFYFPLLKIFVFFY